MVEVLTSRYNSHNTKERLEELNAKKLMTVIPDKDARRTVVAAVKGISSGPVGALCISVIGTDHSLTIKNAREIPI